MRRFRACGITDTSNTHSFHSTGVDIYEFAMSPANDASWGGNMIDEPLKADESGITTLSITEDILVWDLMVVDSEGTSLEFLGLDFSKVNIDAGVKIQLGVTEGGAYVATVQ